MQINVDVTAFSHVGRGRKANQDTLCVGSKVYAESAMISPEQRQLVLNGPLVCAVADGMGGPPGGGKASLIAASVLKHDSKLGSAAGAIESIHQINADLYNVMLHEPELRGMGTTLAGICFHPDRVVWFNVGDSRIYRLRDGFLNQVSIDDKLDGGENEATAHVLTQALGGRRQLSPVEPHAGESDLPCPSRWLLCSDGLSGELSLDEMEKCLACSDEGDAVRALYEGAMARGGRDDISIILASISERTASHGAPHADRWRFERP